MRALSTIVIIYGSLAVYLTLPDAEALPVFAYGAWAMAIVLGIALLIEASAGWKALIRLDIAIFFFLYGLTFAEFLLPNPVLMLGSFGAEAQGAVGIVLVGFAGVAIGRHLVPQRRVTAPAWHLPEIPPKTLFLLLSVCFFGGILHILVSTGFNIGQIIASFGLSRWARPWSRGQYGGLYSLLYEWKLLLNLVPPLTGMIFARWRRYGGLMVLAASAYSAATFLYAFSEGTRNVFITQVVLFAAGYLATVPRISLRTFVVTACLTGVAVVWGSIEMLRFRDVGFSSYSAVSFTQQGTMVDNNLYAISGLMAVFPDRHPYLGLEIIYRAVTLPIPRVLWPGKPAGLSVEAADALGLTGISIASTFVGEGWMSGGLVGVVLFSLAFGAFGAWWNRFGLERVSNLDRVFYATGFLAGAVGCRSVLFLFTALLPAIALRLLGRFLAGRRQAPAPAPRQRFLRRPG